LLTLPKTIEVIRNEDEEDRLFEKTKVWLKAGNKQRDPRIHASDLLDPRKAYWNRKHEEPMTNRMAGNFFVGKTLHAFFLTALAGKTGTDLTDTDVGGTWDPSLQITYSNDFQNKSGTIPGELKTSRALNEQSKRDLLGYIEQLAIYMAAKKSLIGRLVVLRLMGKDTSKGYGSYPQYRAYQIEWTKKDLAAYRKEILATSKLLSRAIKTNKPTLLPLCRDWKCGKSNCGHWAECKPEGRTNDPKYNC
jgi:hypothetical protein